MVSKSINFKKLLKGYDKGWVAISSDFKSVIEFSTTLEDLRKKISKKNIDQKDIYYFPSGESYTNYVG